MKTFIVFALFAATVYCNVQEEKRRLENMTCIDSKAVVEETPEVTYFRIIADSNETLLDINNNNTKLTPFDELLTVKLKHPDNGLWGFTNNSRYYITKNQTTAGDVIRLADYKGFDIFKENVPGTTYNNSRVIKSDIRCAHIHGFSLVIDPAFHINNFDGYQMTPLLWSSLFGLSDVARNLIERGVDVKQKSGDSETPVLAAILANQPELVEIMIQRGANVLQRNYKWFTTLHAAAYVGSPNISRILIDQGVNVNEHDNSFDLTPLHVAATYGQCSIIEPLISKGANVNLLGFGKITAFQIAIILGHFDCGHKLIAAGADVNARNIEGNTALALAIHYHKDESKLLETMDHFLREFNPDVNVQNGDGETALSIATKKNFTKVAELLKSKGAV